jgi:hypothetical protein
MNNFQVIRVEKVKGAGGRGNQMAYAAKHNLREREVRNADGSKDIEKIRGGTSEEIMARWREALPDKYRKDAVVGAHYVVTGSPGRMGELSRDQQDAYFRDALKYLTKKHGDENIIAATIHRDEKTPHLHVLAVPKVERERKNGERYETLAFKSFYNGKGGLSRLQTEFHEKVSKEYGFERGVRYSQARHISPQQYHTEMDRRWASLQKSDSTVSRPIHMPTGKELREKVKNVQKQIKGASKEEAIWILGKMDQRREERAIGEHIQERLNRAEQQNADLQFWATSGKALATHFVEIARQPPEKARDYAVSVIRENREFFERNNLIQKEKPREEPSRDVPRSRPTRSDDRGR